MIIGIDGNCWFCSNGMCLGDPRAEFVFERVLRDAVKKYSTEFNSAYFLPTALNPYMDMTPEEFKAARLYHIQQDDSNG